MVQGFLAACVDAEVFPVTGEELHAAAADLLARLARLGPDVRAARRLIAAGPMPDGD